MPKFQECEEGGGRGGKTSQEVSRARCCDTAHTGPLLFPIPYTSDTYVSQPQVLRTYAKGCFRDEDEMHVARNHQVFFLNNAFCSFHDKAVEYSLARNKEQAISSACPSMSAPNSMLKTAQSLLRLPRIFNTHAGGVESGVSFPPNDKWATQ